MLGRAILVILFAGLAWLAWQKPAPAPESAPVRAVIPVPPAQSIETNSIETEQPTEPADKQLWRVVTHRLVTPDAATTLQRQLQELQLKPLIIQSRESVTLHAFDDPDRFQTQAEAVSREQTWLQDNIDAFVIQDEDGLYMVGLGRFYQVEHAEQMQDKLRNTARPYSYQRRTIPIPISRFTFAASERAEADRLWKQLEAAGIMMPVLMQESHFQELYGNPAEYKISETIE